MSLWHDLVRVESGLVVAIELDMTGVSLIEVRLIAVNLETMKLGKTSKNLFHSKKTVGSDFLTTEVQLVFAKLREAFVKVSIVHYFDLKRHIWIETDELGYAINGVLSRLTSDDSGRCHLFAFFSCKMIPVETRYKMHDDKLLAIVQAFNTWKHHLKGF